MFNISNVFSKDNIDGGHVQNFQITYIFDTTNHLHNIFVNIFLKVHYMWGLNQDLEPQEWKDLMNKKNKSIACSYVFTMQ